MSKNINNVTMEKTKKFLNKKLHCFNAKYKDLFYVLYFSVKWDWIFVVARFTPSELNAEVF